MTINNNNKTLILPQHSLHAKMTSRDCSVSGSSERIKPSTVLWDLGVHWIHIWNGNNVSKQAN